MRTLVRTTLAGNEYWDNEEKRIIFVPVGEAPDFKVTENPESMLHKDLKANVTVNVDLSTTKDLTAINGKVVDLDDDIISDVVLEDLNLKQLKEFAATNKLTIPATIKTRADIVKFLDSELYEDDTDEVLPV